MAVVLDVVYNHFGPDGNFMPRFAPEARSAEHSLPWGDCNDCGSDLRYFFFENALHWVCEYAHPIKCLAWVASRPADASRTAIQPLGGSLLECIVWCEKGHDLSKKVPLRWATPGLVPQPHG